MDIEKIEKIEKIRKLLQVDPALRYTKLWTDAAAATLQSVLDAEDAKAHNQLQVKVKS